MKRGIYFLGLLLSFANYLVAQRIDSVMNALVKEQPLEKIYLHYDKEFYVAGETIWFKAYIYGNGIPVSISSNLYLQFSDKNGSVVFNKKYPIDGAVAKGNIEIPDSLSQGSYYIRAYTTRMLNYDERLIYIKNIFVLNSASNQMLPVIAQEQNLSIQFFPESGNLIDGVLTSIAFKAIDQWGLPVDVEGNIKTEDGIFITPFRSYHAGIGKIQLKPQAGKNYVAELKMVGRISTFPLPPVQFSGVSLKIQNEKKGKKFQLSWNEKERFRFDTLLLVAEMNNNIVYENEILFENYPSVIGHLFTDNLPTGILHFIVYDKNRIPLAERFSFVDNQEYRSTAFLNVIKAGFGKRQENIFELFFQDSSQVNFSVSVTDASYPTSGNNENIYSRLLLNSYIKDYIFNPAYYFESQNDSTVQALDNFLLTIQPNNFNKAKVFSSWVPKNIYRNDYLINISGKIFSESEKELVKGGKLNVLLSDEDSSLYSFDIQVKENGQFLIDSLKIYGKTRIYYSYKNKHGKETPVAIKIDESDLPNISMEVFSDLITKYPVIQPKSFGKSGLINSDVSIKKDSTKEKLLENVVVTSTQKRQNDEMNEKYTSEIFRSGGKIMIDNINSPPVDKTMNGLDFVLNRITTIGVQYGTFVNRKNFSLLDNREKKNKNQNINTTVSGLLRYWEVGLLINEIPADLIQLKTLRADQIAIVKFFEAGSLGAGGTYPGGAIVVYLNYETKMTGKRESPKYFEFNGYSLCGEFYGPDYSIEGTNKGEEDIRTTLYWNPEIIRTKQSKTVRLGFFNNDYSKKFRVVIEGFDSLGKLFHIEKIISN